MNRAKTNKLNFLLMTALLAIWMLLTAAAIFFREDFSGAPQASTAAASDLSTAALPPSGERAAASEQIRTAYGKLPLTFEKNVGQTADARVNFTARGAGYSLFLTPDEAVFVLSRQEKSKNETGVEPKQSDSGKRETAALRMKLVGADGEAASVGAEEQAGKVNYLVGDDQSKWQTNVSTFARVNYKNVYAGIDLTYYGNQRQLEYDFVVAPEADYRQIKLNFDGAEKTEIEAGSGDLLLHTPLGVVREHEPRVYQEIDGQRREIASGYVKRGREIGFEIGEYDRRLPLVIDPTLVYSSYLGGSGDDIGNGIAVDSSGNAYVTGQTVSTNFPTQNPLQTNGGGGDAFVTKVSADGRSLVYSTYLGGSGSDIGYSIAVDSSGSVYVAGYTASTNFPTQNPFQTNSGGASDAFVTKIAASGQSLVYSTYAGGSGSDQGRSIAVDSVGSAYVSGTTNSANFPTLGAFQTSGGGNFDLFVTKFSATGQALVYSTYLGGSGSDQNRGIALDSNGNAYVTGSTESTNFPTRNPFQATNGGSADAFAAKIAANGQSLVYSTYLGGGVFDVGTSIAVGSTGDAYITGFTDSTNFPMQNPLQANSGGENDAFVAKLGANGQSLVYSTYLGGNGSDNGVGVAVDSTGNAYVTGSTSSTNFPTQNPLQASKNGNYDLFVTKVGANGQSLVYSTYLGGSGDKDYGYGIAVDSTGNAYITGITTSTNFPTLTAFQTNSGGGTDDSFVAKIFDPSAATPTPTVTPTPGNCVAPPAGIVAWYPGDESAVDIIGGNNGTLQGGAGYASGKVAQAFSLNGSNAFVQAAGTAANDPTTAGSLEAWVNFNQLPSSAGHVMEIIGKGGSGADFDLQAETDNRFRFYVANSNSVASTTVVQTGVWYHVVAAWDSTVGIKIYVNGALENTNGALVTRAASGQPLQIGNQPVFGPRLFSGLIDEASIYNRALAAAEAQAIYNAGAAGKCKSSATRKAPFDFDGDGRTDFSINQFMTATDAADFRIRKSSDGNLLGYSWGLPNDKIAVADYDGDGTTDIAVWRDEPSDPDRANFYVHNSSGAAVRVEQLGRTGDNPLVVGDWDGDGRADPAVYRAGAGGAQSYFFYKPSTQPLVKFVSVPWGIGGDEPVRGDFDGDGRMDAAVFRPSNQTWYIARSSDGALKTMNWGLASDKRVSADFDGDGRTDFAVFRPSDGVWYVLQSSDSQFRFRQFGLSTDTPVAGDYDGDRRADFAVYRAGSWFVLRSSDGAFAATGYGSSADAPVPAAYQQP